MTNEEKFKIGYYNIHWKLIKQNGNASYCSNPNCCSKNPKRYEWALKKGRKYTTNINDYTPLCCSCHRKYDLSESTVNKLKISSKGNKNAIKPVIGTCLKSGKSFLFNSVKEASEKLRISKSGISNCLTGISSMSGGMKWGYQIFKTQTNG